MAQMDVRSQKDANLRSQKKPSNFDNHARNLAAHLRDVGGISACAAGDVAKARALHAAGWEAAHAVDKFGSTALMWASSYGALDAARWLVDEAGVDADAVEAAGVGAGCCSGSRSRPRRRRARKILRRRIGVGIAVGAVWVAQLQAPAGVGCEGRMVAPSSIPIITERRCDRQRGAAAHRVVVASQPLRIPNG